jgi:hypothetical protein
VTRGPWQKLKVLFDPDAIEEIRLLPNREAVLQALDRYAESGEGGPAVTGDRYITSYLSVEDVEIEIAVDPRGPKGLMLIVSEAHRVRHDPID